MVEVVLRYLDLGLVHAYDIILVTFVKRIQADDLYFKVSIEGHLPKDILT